MGTPLNAAPWMTRLPEFRPGAFAGILHAQQNRIMQENQRRAWEMDDLNQAQQRLNNQQDQLKLDQDTLYSKEVAPWERQDKSENFQESIRRRPTEKELFDATGREKLADLEDQKKKREALDNAEWAAQKYYEMENNPIMNQEEYLKFVDEADKKGIKMPRQWTPETKDRWGKFAQEMQKRIPGMRMKLDEEERKAIALRQLEAIKGSTRAAVAREQAESRERAAQTGARARTEAARIAAAARVTAAKTAAEKPGSGPKTFDQALVGLVMSKEIDTPEGMDKARKLVAFESKDEIEKAIAANKPLNIIRFKAQQGDPEAKKQLNAAVTEMVDTLLRNRLSVLSQMGGGATPASPTAAPAAAPTQPAAPTATKRKVFNTATGQIEEK